MQQHTFCPEKTKERKSLKQRGNGQSEDRRRLSWKKMNGRPKCSEWLFFYTDLTTMIAWFQSFWVQYILHSTFFLTYTTVLRSTCLLAYLLTLLLYRNRNMLGLLPLCHLISRPPANFEGWCLLKKTAPYVRSRRCYLLIVCSSDVCVLRFVEAIHSCYAWSCLGFFGVLREERRTKDKEN